MPWSTFLFFHTGLCTGQCIAMYFTVQGSTLQCKVYAVLSHNTLLFFHTSLCRVLYSVITLYVKLTLFSHPGLFTEQCFTVLSHWPPHLNFDKAGGSNDLPVRATRGAGVSFHWKPLRKLFSFETLSKPLETQEKHSFHLKPSRNLSKP